MAEYLVALRGMRGSGSNCGITNWVKFESKEAFDIWFDDKVRGLYKLVEEGITESRAQELCRRMPLPFHLAAREDARIDEARLEERFEPGWNESDATYDLLRESRDRQPLGGR